MEEKAVGEGEEEESGTRNQTNTTKRSTLWLLAPRAGFVKVRKTREVSVFMIVSLKLLSVKDAVQS